MTVARLLFVLLLLLAGGLLCFAAVRVFFRPEDRWRRGDRPLRAYRYRAVELRLCNDPCESALAIAGKRILESEAPALPLPGCGHKKCACHYARYDDRRYAQRRISSAHGSPPRLGVERDRREPGRDRRSE